MNKNHWRMENAKLARAYVRGGEAPFQVANKLGFHSVMDMEAAIHQLENLEEHPAIENRDPLRESGEYRSEPFLVKRFAASKEHPEMIRIWCGGRPNYVYFEPGDVKKLVRLLNEATGVMDELYQELAELKDERDAEAKGQLEELQKNEELRARIQALEESDRTMRLQLQCAQPNEEILVDNERLHQKVEELKFTVAQLKEKIVEMVMAV